ncbi:hypothetical protein [Tahibacter amnicola]|uniref:Outer membrane protein assembly factor BamC n=1 Tax=Tahibacter amnicola TaxID=2976241 RepID=A0ABY6BAN0_9GAMM|nr:hypothetical protein [Tahibacter amnicola]UXI66915.1 hypothetical protein N4264_19470 [Tahibacter amnicola]
MSWFEACKMPPFEVRVAQPVSNFDEGLSVNSKSAIRSVLLVALVPLVLGGCNLFKSRSDWDKAVEARPLEVPPDLETPATSSELIVPEGRGGAASDTAARRAAGSTSVGIDGLHVNDTVDSAWQRIGKALERANLGDIAKRDESLHTYEVNVKVTRTTGDDGGFFKRLFTRKRVETSVQKVSVGVSSDGDGSRVSVSGDGAAVQKVVALLRERLG